MTLSSAARDVVQFLRSEFASRAQIDVLSIDTRSYPEETNYIVYVAEDDVAEASAVGNALDDELAEQLPRAFVVVRKAGKDLASQAKSTTLTKGVQDPRATDLIRLISARSRVSLAQPSLSYVRDAEANISAVTAGRHHLIFGRRGAGKTALLVEARQQLQREGAITAWVNIQTLRNESPDRVILYVLEELLSQALAAMKHVKSESVVSVDLTHVYESVRGLLLRSDVVKKDVTGLAPRVQRALSRFLDIEGASVFVFLDDFYYLPRQDQPGILDLLHGCVRDCDAWLKVASIRHLTRWFQSSPPLGLQTIHDADTIDLDVTLQDPGRAQDFLENVLQRYSTHVGVPALTRLFSSTALDRLVLASGAVPRDYLVLASSAIAKSQNRQNATLVGAQDVNQAAGDAAGAKLQELEDDMASNVGTADRTLSALKVVRDFCLEEKSYTYFLVSYRDKEARATEYNLLTDLMDVRLVHLLDSGVSDPHAAGQRSEAFLLDLSQYSGSRLKQRIQVLDFSKGRVVSRQTRTAGAPKIGNTPLQVISILRGAPMFSLDRLSEIASRP
ncbi:hypothetical protein [Nocardioides houyundeii]|uniref:hypothetical protein n=1 Tax=Nocardioides houyundeii TaxID=2045452 RepID=UPI0013B3A120|nr:hypothetical protein [Nocardioides houyundeii]